MNEAQNVATCTSMNEENLDCLLDGVSSSPWDIFYYPNTLPETIENCTPHFDPGFLSIAPVATVPGLLVQDASSGDWLTIDAEGWFTPGSDVVVFLGGSMQVTTNGIYPATPHAVARSKLARCSLIYELQTSTGHALTRANTVKSGGPGWISCQEPSNENSTDLGSLPCQDDDPMATKLTSSIDSIDSRHVKRKRSATADGN